MYEKLPLSLLALAAEDEIGYLNVLEWNVSRVFDVGSLKVCTEIEYRRKPHMTKLTCKSSQVRVKKEGYWTALMSHKAFASKMNRPRT